jgi:hypothetical protein
MIRFIIKTETKFGSHKHEAFYTFVQDVPVLEQALKNGGINRETDEYEAHSLIGVEVVEDETK